MKHLSDYYLLCEVMDDDIEMVAKIIHHHQKQKEKVNKIMENCENGKVLRYDEIIKEVLDQPINYIRAFQTIYKGLFQ